MTHNEKQEPAAQPTPAPTPEPSKEPRALVYQGPNPLPTPLADAEGPLSIHIPLYGIALKRHIWNTVSGNFPNDRDHAIELAKLIWELHTGQPQAQLDALRSKLALLGCLKELTPGFRDHGAGEYLKGAIAWYQAQ